MPLQNRGKKLVEDKPVQTKEEELLLRGKNIINYTGQLLKLAEECSELSASILRFVNKTPWSRSENILFMEMLEELEDTSIMIAQVRTYHDPEIGQAIRDKKLMRYESRIESK